MSLEEIVARAELTVKKKSWRGCQSWLAPKSNILGKDTWVLPPLPQSAVREREGILEEADRYLQGKYTLLNISFEEPEIDWHRDPQTGKRAPQTFGPDLNYRDSTVTGNVKNIWEKNRHHHLTVLSLAYALTEDKRYAETVEAQLLSWVEQNPFPIGVNWTSSLEFGVRLISWVWIDRLLRGSPSHTHLFGEKGVLWDTVYWHQWLISQHYSHGSSANNHLIGEMAGLSIAAQVWPFFPESSQWQVLSRKILEREISLQTFSTGLNREQAFSYHIFSLEFFLLAGIEAQRLGTPFSANYQQWVQRMLEVIPLVVDVGGNLLQYGDGDDGMALLLRPLDSSRLDWLFRLGRQCFKAQVPLPKDDEGILAATLIWDNPEQEAIEYKLPQNSVKFDDAGIYVLTNQRGSRSEIFCVADAGPLGFLSIAAHGHADALSFTLSVAGVPVIVDPGTYIYHADMEWRKYFRSTKAHNTVTVDNCDQSVAGGIFIWVEQARSNLIHWEEKPEGAVLVAEHDGYTRLAGRVVHQRKLELKNKRLEIGDRLEGNGVHSLEWRLHFSPLCRVDLRSDICQVTWDGGRLEIHLDSQMQWVLARGEKEAGWYSSGFNLKESIYTLVGTLDTKLPVSLTNSLDISHES
nr:alginate lyase family protein [Argonema antarcticum]